MVSGTGRTSGKACAVWVLTALACTSQLTLVAITIYLTTNAGKFVLSIHHTAWAASASDIVAVLVSPGAAYLYISRTGRQIRAALCAVFVLIATLAACLTIYTLTLIWVATGSGKASGSKVHLVRSLTISGFAVWSVAIIAQIALFVTIMCLKGDGIAQLPAEELTERPSPTRSVKRSLSMHIASLSPPRPPPFSRSESEPSSPTFSTQSSSPKSSFRHSMNQAMRPVTSKTRLILRHPSLSRDSSSFHTGRETSLEALRRDDEFEDWDTSGVDDVDESHWFGKTTNTKTRLETIPGSRPVSPAKPLDGPFPDELPEEVHLPESPVQSPMASPTAETGSFRLSRPPTRRGSSIDQSHIHPLFRSESPVPPPLASPGTVITASPFAGQVISPEHQTFVSRKLHSAQSFRPESPNPLSPPRSRQGSFRSFQLQQSSAGEQYIVASRPPTRDSSTEQTS